VAQIYPRALGSLYVVSYGGGILTLPLPGGTGPVQSQVNVKVQNQSHVTTDYLS
jgi:hypothetical protein